MDSFSRANTWNFQVGSEAEKSRGTHLSPLRLFPILSRALSEGEELWIDEGDDVGSRLEVLFYGKLPIFILSLRQWEWGIRKFSEDLIWRAKWDQGNHRSGFVTRNIRGRSKVPEAISGRLEKRINWTEPLLLSEREPQLPGNIGLNNRWVKNRWALGGE